MALLDSQHPITRTKESCFFLTLCFIFHTQSPSSHRLPLQNMLTWASSSLHPSHHYSQIRLQLFVAPVLLAITQKGFRHAPLLLATLYNTSIPKTVILFSSHSSATPNCFYKRKANSSTWDLNLPDLAPLVSFPDTILHIPPFGYAKLLTTS